MNMNDQPLYYSKEFLKPVQNSISILEKSLQQLDNAYMPATKALTDPGLLMANHQPPDAELKEQLGFLHRISKDIGKLTQSISA
jgi:hypothetical protein